MIHHHHHHYDITFTACGGRLVIRKFQIYYLKIYSIYYYLLPQQENYTILDLFIIEPKELHEKVLYIVIYKITK